MHPKYASALEQFPSFAAAAEALLPDLATEHARLTAQVTAPVLFAYVWYVLREAEAMGLKRLYFLARDGYVLLEIAREIAAVHPVNLELRYLYCSRASLRMPTYHRIAPEEALDLLLHRGTNLTRRHILDRAHLTDAQRKAVYEQLHCREEEEQTPLTEGAFAAFCQSLRSSSLFLDYVNQNSREAYDAAMGYFRQEGLTDSISFGIVDSGWTGSMQRSLRQLSDEIPPITGFYFGMFARPQAAEDGTYRTWYFSADSSIGIRTKFSNNVFECMCAAAHGMTMGYRKETDTRYVPVCRETAANRAMHPVIETQLEVCRRFAAQCAQQISYDSFPDRTLHRISRKLLQGLMYRTDRAEAEAFADFPFCDDVTESYTSTLVRRGQETVLREHMLLHRLLRRLRGRKPSEELFWMYGTLAVSSLRLKALCRPALRAWDILRYWIDSCKQL